MSSGVSFVVSTGVVGVLPVARVVNPSVSREWLLREQRTGASALTTNKGLSLLDGAQHLVHAEARHISTCLGVSSAVRVSVAAGFGFDDAQISAEGGNW